LRVLLCLDEIEKLGETVTRGWGANLLDLLRHIAQHHSRIVLLFAAAHTFSELGPAWTDRFLGVRRVRVTYLTPEDVRPLLAPEIPGFDLVWLPEAVDALVTATRGQPFLTQAVAFELIQHLNEHKARRAKLRDVEVALERALESGAEYFGYLWSDAGPAGQVILTEAAFNRPLPESPVEWRRLRAQEVLDDAGRIIVPLVERWVREKSTHA